MNTNTHDQIKSHLAIPIPKKEKKSIEIDDLIHFQTIFLLNIYRLNMKLSKEYIVRATVWRCSQSVSHRLPEKKEGIVYLFIDRY